MVTDPPRLQFRRAISPDLPRLVQLLADDPIAAGREAPAGSGDGEVAEGYRRAFAELEADPRQVLLVAETAGRVVGLLQLTFIPGLTYAGGERAQIEGVRVDRTLRGGGVGRAMIEHAIGLARQRGCVLVQLTTDKRRPEAHRFYEALGFIASHEGFKLRL